MDSQEEEVDSQAEEDLYKVIPREDHQEIDSWAMRRSSTTEIPKGPKNL